MEALKHALSQNLWILIVLALLVLALIAVTLWSRQRRRKAAERGEPLPSKTRSALPWSGVPNARRMGQIEPMVSLPQTSLTDAVYGEKPKSDGRPPKGTPPTINARKE